MRQGLIDWCTHILKSSDRTKFQAWSKKYAKMEELVLEFEAKAEVEEEKYGGFAKEVQEKLDAMVSFKKSFQKFQLSVETALKKVDYVHMHIG